MLCLFSLLNSIFLYFINENCKIFFKFSHVVAWRWCSGQFSINSRCPREKKNEFMFSERREKGFHCKNQNVNNVKSVFTNKSK